MNKRITLLRVVTVVGFFTLCGCTFNIYHSRATPGVKIESSLAVPESRDEKNSNRPKTSNQGIKSIVMPDAVMSMAVNGSTRKSVVTFNENVVLRLQLAVDAYVNCYYQQASGEIIRVFPNRFAPRYWLYADQSIKVPATQSFQVVADVNNSNEGFLCLASMEDVLSQLPAVYRANVFQTLPANNFDELYALYRQSTEVNLIGRALTYAVR